jgi:predicted nucleotidyltransferase
VLRHLVRDNREQSGREIARAVGLSPKPLNQVLAQLADEKVLLRRNVGRVYLFQLHRDNLLVADLVVPLFEGEEKLLDRALADVLDGVPNILSAVLYGSVSRGEEKPSSDLDLLVVTENGTETVKDILLDRTIMFMGRYGNFLSFIVMSSDEFRSDYQEGDDFLREVLRTGRVVLGQLPLELVYGSG